MQVKMKFRSVGKIHFALSFVLSSIILAPTSSLIAIPQNDSLSSHNRSTTMFRILKDAGIKFEKTRAKALRLIESEEFSEVRNLCNSFVKDIGTVRSSLRVQVGLTKNDVRYVDKSLAQFQKRIEQLLDSLPLGY